MKFNNIKTWLMLSVMAVMGATIVSCADQPDKFELADGVPTVMYVRSPKASASDSLMSGAFMGNSICLVGNNLKSIKEIYFNDQKAVINTSYVTDHTFIVDVPKTIPTDVKDKIFMVTKNNDTIPYDFKVYVPSPQVNSMACEYVAPGKEVTVYGDYFIDDPQPAKALTITMAGNVKVTQITSISKTQMSFIVPENAVPGYITVKTQYGVGRSKFQYRDPRNILFDWDGSHGGLTTGQGWRNGVIHTSGTGGIVGIDGSYLYFGGVAIKGDIGGTWAEDNFCMNYWPDTNSATMGALSDRPEFKELLATYGVDKLQIKFEYYVPTSNPWKSAALQIMFTNNVEVTNATGNNSYYGASFPRGLWLPWKDSGSFDSGDQWKTCTIKLSEFNKNNDGTTNSTPLDVNHFTGLTLFVWHGGVAGVDCEPVICIDNIRVVPID